MFKPSIMLADVLDPPQSWTIRLWTIISIAVSLFVVPLAMEMTLICYSQWCEVMGDSIEVGTPIIDAIGQSTGDACELLVEILGPPWHAATHDPFIALPLMTISIVTAMAMLR